MKNSRVVYYISGLSPATLPLVRSIRAKEKHDKIQTSKITIANVERDGNISEKKMLKALGCKVTAWDIPTLSTKKQLKRNDRRKTLYRFILIHTDTERNTKDALNLVHDCRNRLAVEIYSLSPGSGTEFLFDSVDKGSSDASVPPVKLRRIHFARNTIYRSLMQQSMFQLAREHNGEKTITVVIIGMDAYGIEMLKACLWCGQMDHYVLKIHVLDSSPDADERFYFMAPEIRIRNKLPRSGEDYYELDFHTSIDPHTSTLSDTLCRIQNPSWVFISLGNDTENLNTAIRVREIYAQQNLYDQYLPLHYTVSQQLPYIQTVIENDDTAELLNNNQLKNYRNECYDIHAVGSLNSLYSLDSICNTELEALALQAHMKWGDQDSFNSHEYHRRSSMASAIHKKYRDEIYPDDHILKDILEHRRWNAYMRGTEGYQFGLIRDDLAKQHNCLVKFDDLTKHEKKKDNFMNQA